MRTRLVTTCWPAAISLAVGACAGQVHRASPPLAQRVAGCYQLRDGPWKTDSLLQRFYDVSRLPTRLQFDTARVAGMADEESDTFPMFVVRTAGRWSSFEYWQQMSTDADSIVVGRVVSFGGAQLRLVPRDGRLVGTIGTGTGDIPRDGVSDAEAPIILDRAACPTFDTWSDSALRRVLATFSEGDPIRVALMRSRWTGTYMGTKGDTLFFGTVGKPPMGLRFNAVDTVWARGSMMPRWRQVYPP